MWPFKTKNEVTRSIWEPEVGNIMRYYVGNTQVGKEEYQAYVAYYNRPVLDTPIELDPNWKGNE